MERLYIIRAVDPISGLQQQRSDVHTWDECEFVYQAYIEDYPDFHVLIVPVE